jgi:hypothetical protein
MVITVGALNLARTGGGVNAARTGGAINLAPTYAFIIIILMLKTTRVQVLFIKVCVKMIKDDKDLHSGYLSIVSCFEIISLGTDLKMIKMFNGMITYVVLDVQGLRA